MNYFPYGMGYPYFSTPVKSAGLFSRLLGGINFRSILSGTQKTLSFVNQTIPTIKQITPVFKNAKTMFKVMNEFKKVDVPITNSKTESITSSEINQENSQTSYQGPTFFA